MLQFPHRVNYLLLGLGYVVLYGALGWALRGYPSARAIFGNVGLLLPAIAVCAIILRRRSEWRGCQRLFWDVFGIGVAMWIVGHLGWAYMEIVTGRVSWLAWHTPFSLCAGIAPLIALLLRPHRGVRADAVGSLGLALASYGVLTVFIYTYFVLVPSLVLEVTSAQNALFVLVQVNRALLFGLLAGTAWSARGTSWGATFTVLAVGAGLGFVLRFLTSVAITRGLYQSGTLYDMAWILPFLCYGWAALHAPASPPQTERIELPTRDVPLLVSAIPVFLIPLIGYGTLYFQPLPGTGDAFRTLLTGVMTVGGLGVLTLRLAAQGGELQRADSRLRLLAAATEQTADLILITGADGRLEHANDAFVRAMGYSRAELADGGFADLIEPGFASVGPHIDREVRQHGIWRGTLVRRRRDGTTFPASCTVVGLRDASGRITHFVGVERDTTDELKLRDQLVHTERLSAIGELVAGVAHEINNPLQTIVGSVELLLEEESNPASRRDLEVVRREAARAGQIVRNLLSFVRRSAPDRVQADLNDIVRRTVELREYHLRQRNIGLSAELHPEPLGVLVNREEIQQVVLNLVLNAEHAIAGAGGEGQITIRTFTSGRRHMVEVTDTGPGVSAELRGRIFEPFFTTKDVGEGTGLGLSISHGIAAAHAGSLELSPVASGACFRLTLPAHAVATREEQRVATPGGAQAPPRRLALVVDDEPAIRKLLVRMLERRGYAAVEADTGDAALAIAGRQAPHLVLCEVRMPGMSGIDLYRALAGHHRGRGAFIFITGDRASVSPEEGGTAGVPVLVKPFNAADLDAALTLAGIDTIA